MNAAISSRLNRLRNLTITRQQAKQKVVLFGRSIAPIVVALGVSGVAHAQGSMDFSQAKSSTLR